LAQFGADRALTFWNQPFARLFDMPPDWLAERPEFDRVLERMRDNHQLPEVRDFPGMEGGSARLVPGPGPSHRRGVAAARRGASARRRAAVAGRRAAADL
jgi:hypothetical protein